MSCNVLCCCFSGEPLNQDEVKGRRGGSYAKYLAFREKFQISMVRAPRIM